MSTGTGREWLILLEAADEHGRSTIDPSSFARLVCSWASPAPMTLYSPNRYALQVPVRGMDAASALSSAISLWKDALRRTGLPEWELVRSEILTPEELEQELEAAECRGDAQQLPPHARCRIGEAVGEDLLRRALHDGVTGLPSRELFVDHVRRALGTGGPASGVQAVMIVHLDGLDTASSSPACFVPDDVAVEIASRLTEVVRRGDTVARVGPAQFAVLVEAAAGKGTDCLARRILDQFHCPLSDDARPLAVTASVGVATSSSSNDDADQLILMAEVAVVEARKAGGNCHRSFAPDPDSA